MSEPSNGLGQFMALANLTVVGALILVFVVLAIWVVTKGIPGIINKWDAAQQRSEIANAESRREFVAALNQQAAARSESAKGGHDAAIRIADSLNNLAIEVRRANSDRDPCPPSKNGKHRFGGS